MRSKSLRLFRVLLNLFTHCLIVFTCFVDQGFCIEIAEYLKGNHPKTMIIGSGHKIAEVYGSTKVYNSDYFLLDINPKVEPDLVADLKNPKTTEEIPNESFDVIYIEGIPNSEYTSDGIRGLRRMIKPGGKLIYSVGKNRLTLTNFLDLLIPSHVSESLAESKVAEMALNPSAYATLLEPGVYCAPNLVSTIGIDPRVRNQGIWNDLFEKYAQTVERSFLQNAGYNVSDHNFQFQRIDPLHPNKTTRLDWVTVVIPPREK